MSAAAPASQSAIHWPCLVLALAVMLAGTLYPPLLADASGHPDHVLAMALFWAMSAGFVRGVGFVPRRLPWRWLLGAPSVAVAGSLAVAARFLQ